MTHPYDALSPERVLDLIELTGHEPDGSLLELNSYENRVYQVGMNEGPPMVAKFYRPDRWSNDAILEEHVFSLALAQEEIPVIAPWQSKDGTTMFEARDFRFALFARQGGRSPELDNLDHLEWIGRLMARIHLQGAAGQFQHRLTIDIDRMGYQAASIVLESALLPVEFRSRYETITKRLLEYIQPVFQESPGRRIRLHGDCHPGNILWTDDGPHFVDMDDCMTGPAIQDLWMLLSGDRREMTLQLDAILEGYRTFHSFDMRELALIEPLRTLRIIHYAAWLVQRWDDPAFPRAFSWFDTPAYWEEHLNILETQLEMLDQPPLMLV